MHPSKTIFLEVFSYKQVLNFRNLIAKEKNPQKKLHQKKKICE